MCYVSVIGVNLFSRDEYFDKILRKSGSNGSLKVPKSAVKLLDEYCLKTYDLDTTSTLAEIKKLMDANPNDSTPMVFLDKYTTYVEKVGKRHSTIKSYTNQGKTAGCRHENMMPHFAPNCHD